MVGERGAGGRVASWPERVGARAKRAAPWIPPRFAELFDAAGRRISAWTAAEASAGRFVPWLTVAFGGGILLYFAAPREPQLWAVAGAAIVASTIAFWLRSRALGFACAALAAAIVAGFAHATINTARGGHPVLARAVFGAEVAGFVERREERERSDRITIAVTAMSGRGVTTPLQRVRVAVRKGTAPAIGSHVALKARLSPPLQPLRPGGYDFARDLYFQGIGATGFVLGKVQTRAAPGPVPMRLRFAAAVAGVRDAIDGRIRAAVPGDAGAIASALITGKRDAISADVNDAMYVSSLAHVLSVSGYHMAVVAGVVFFTVRALLALSAGLALRRPIKKWAAAVALVAASAYLVLTGAEVATQRAYVMTAIVLIGVMLDRAALTMRTLAVAAAAVLIVSPEAVVHPSFQMSFAATLALVAVYERGLPILNAAAKSPLAARIALWGGREVASLIVASLVAGAATTLFAAYHFHRLAPYGLIANLLAMPVVSCWVMPLGLLGLLAMPFGFDEIAWRLMGLGVDWMTGVAGWVASLPGAVGHVKAFGSGPLIIATAGFLALCMLRSPLRFGGVGVLLIGIGLASRTPRPDVLVAPGAEAVAVRTATGRLAILKVGSDGFAIREWLAADGDPRNAGDPGLREGFACDGEGCVATMADGTRIAVSMSAAAVVEDCAAATLVVTRRARPPDCKAEIIDRERAAENGALALIRAGDAWHAEAGRPPTEVRPWTRPQDQPSARRPAARPGASSAATAPDATPAVDALAADD